MRRAQFVMALALLVAAGVLLREALRLKIAWTSIGPGAGFFPFLLSLGVVFNAVIIFVQRVRAPAKVNNDEPFVEGRSYKPLLLVFLPMVAVIVLINQLGLYLGGAVYLAGYMWLVGRHRWISIILVSVLIPLALFFIFEKWFLLPLPKGIILERLLYGE